MNPPWQVNKTNHFIQCVDREKISDIVLESIELWAKTVTLTQTKNFRLYFVSPKRIFQIWNAKLPDPDYKKGRRGGFRLVCFFNIPQKQNFLDMIDRRVDLGGKKEHPKAQQEYTKYLEELKKILLDIYEKA